MKICQRAILGLACSILLLDALWTTAVYASSPETETASTSQEDQTLTLEEVKAWMDENQIEYTVRSEQANSYRPTRAELTALFLNDEFQSRNPTSSSWDWESFSEPLSDLALADGDRWQRHSCHPRGNAFLELGGQTLTGIRDGGLPDIHSYRKPQR